MCEETDESLDHLYINYRYTKAVWLEFAELIGNALWKVLNRLVLINDDMRVGDVIEGSNVSKDAPHVGAYIGSC